MAITGITFFCMCLMASSAFFSPVLLKKWGDNEPLAKTIALCLLTGIVLFLGSFLLGNIEQSNR